jgi:hypothetical protein
MDVHYSSKSDDWATPQALFDELDAEFGFTIVAHPTRTPRPTSITPRKMTAWHRTDLEPSG